MTEETFDDIYGTQTFTYSSSDETIVELKDNGRNIKLTWANRAEYVKLVKEFRLYECDTQVQAIRRGLTSVIPARFLSLLTWKVRCLTPCVGLLLTQRVLVLLAAWLQELELEVCGSPEVDIEMLKQHTTYSGCAVTDPHITHFWAVLNKFSQLERCTLAFSVHASCAHFDLLGRSERNSCVSCGVARACRRRPSSPKR